MTAATVTFLIVAIAFLSPILAPHTPFDPATLSLSDGLKPPAMLSADGDWTFPLGTDDLLKSAKDVKPSTKAWFESAKNYAIYSNQSGFYDDVLEFLGIRK